MKAVYLFDYLYYNRVIDTIDYKHWRGSSTMTTLAIDQKKLISIVSTDVPLQACPIGTHLFIKKDMYNRYDKKALSALVKHKKTGKWTFIGYVAAKKEYLPENGLNNADLYDLLDPMKLAVNGKVVAKRDVIFSYGQTATSLVVEVDLGR